MADPVADFLAREQNLFAEFDGAPPGEAEHNANADEDDFGDLQAAGGPTVHGADSGVDLSGMMDEVPVAPAVASVPLVNGNGHLSEASSKGTSPIPMSVPRIDAEKIRLWKEQQRQLLEKKDAAEEKKKDELRASAKKELEEWYRQREKTLALTHDENKKNEKANLEAFAKQQDGEAQWVHVGKMVDSKSKSTKDLSRLKSLLAGLKIDDK